MAGRGARSRKVLDKEIEKQEAKREGSDYSNSVRIKSPSGLSDFEKRAANNLPTKPHTKSRTTKSSAHGSPRPSSVGGLSTFSSVSSISDIDSKNRFKVKGVKETSAPRGRGGGVPAKPSLPAHRPAERKGSITSSHHQAHNIPKDWLRTTIWSGNGRMLQQYGGFDNDPDMWMEDGDCHVFFTEETNMQYPRPSMCLHVHQLEKAKSTLLSSLLKYSVLERDDDMISPVSSGNSFRNGPRRKNSYKSLDDSDIDMGQQWNSRDLPLRSRQGSTATRASSRTAVAREPHNLKSINEQMYGAISEGGSSAGASYHEPEITHEMWFPAPSYLKTFQEQRRHHLAQRNFFALLYNKPLVGADFFEMLDDLQGIIETFYELDNCAPGMSAQMIIRYITERKLDDVRNNVKMALGLLAWSEREDVQWQQGYMEAFVHCAGMMTPKVAESLEFRRVSTVTRHNLDNAAGMLQLKVMEAEDKLARFNFADMLPVLKNAKDMPPWQRSFEAFQEFLIEFYRIIFAAWPPESKQRGGSWLTRNVVARLQTDFGASYDYFVDRDIAWSESEERSSRKWQMISRHGGQEALKIDPPDLPLTDILVGFDNLNAYLHIPHPHPLLPHTTGSGTVSTVKKGFFSAFKRSKPAPKDLQKEQLQQAVAFNGASNLDKLGTNFKSNDLVDQIVNYEKGTALHGVGAQDARLGRWILMYAVLQVLSTLSVDTNGIKHTEGVDYFLCPSLKKCPPWESKVPHSVMEASQDDSYCWLAPMRWEGRIRPTPRALNFQALELDATPRPATSRAMPLTPEAGREARPRTSPKPASERHELSKDALNLELPKLDTLMADAFKLDQKLSASSDTKNSATNSPIHDRIAKYREMSPHMPPLRAPLRQPTPEEKNAFAPEGHRNAFAQTTSPTKNKLLPLPQVTQDDEFSFF